MRAKLETLFNITGSRRPGNQIDRARHKGAVLAVSAQAAPAFFISTCDLFRAQHNNVIFRLLQQERMGGWLWEER